MSVDKRPIVLCDCPFFPEFQEEIDKHVHCIFVTEVLGKGVDEIGKTDVVDMLSGKIGKLLVALGDVLGVISHQHVGFGKAELDLLPNIRVVSNHGVGHGHIDSAYLKNRGIPMGYTPGIPSPPTAELGVALILASARNVVQSVKYAADPKTISFNPYWYGRGVTGATLGVVGMGEMGVQLVKKMKGFDMQVLYWNRTRKELLETALGMQYCSELSDLLSRSDFVVLCVASSPETRYMMSATQFQCMKRDATLVNMARGDIVVQDDLVEALQKRTIAAAALDVTSPEPLPRDHPLLKMDNVIVTSHIGSATKEARRNMAMSCLNNLMAGLENRPLPVAVHQAGPQGVKRKANGLG